MATSVIIPARNEERTIADICAVFNLHPETTGKVYVGLDADTTDDTAVQARANGAIAYDTGARGKGQVVKETILVSNPTRRIILCDADYTGLRLEHVSQILAFDKGMTVGIPDWPDIEVPRHVTIAWPWVSGFRCLPWSLVPANAHGYMLETQLNLIAVKHNIPIQNVWAYGLKSPFQWPLSEQRQAELERDRKWGKENGIL